MAFCIADGEPPDAGINGGGGDGTPAAFGAATAACTAISGREGKASGEGEARWRSGRGCGRSCKRDQTPKRPTPGHLLGGALGQMGTAVTSITKQPRTRVSMLDEPSMPNTTPNADPYATVFKAERTRGR